jgi:uncharacterized protein with FMN-binding domain
MKRFLLIAAGAAGGLGAVLSVTPPQLGAADSGLGTGTAIVPTSTKTPAPTSTNTSKPTKPTANPGPTKTATPTPPPVKSTSGTFTGPVVNVSYGNVQVEITVTNGQITDARALQAPSGRNDRYTNFALPILKDQTLAAQSTNIQGASGASYTTYGWRKSLQGAMVKAGL